MKLYALFFSLVIMGPLAIASSAVKSPSANEISLLEFSVRVAIDERARSQSTAVREAERACAIACERYRAIEFAVGLLGASRGVAGTEYFIGLLGLRLDGEASEIFSCEILNRGQSVLTRLNKAQTDKIAARCRDVFSDLRKNELRKIQDVDMSAVCRSEGEIRSVRDELVAAIKAKATCK